MYIGIHVEYPLLSSDYSETWIFLTDFQENLKPQISWNSVQWQLSCPMQTDIMKLPVAFANLWTRLKMGW